MFWIVIALLSSVGFAKSRSIIAMAKTGGWLARKRRRLF
jgi:hypothetical protein